MTSEVGNVGLLLPTFDRLCTRQRLLDTARKAEGYGFGSLWVRDHLFVDSGTEHGGIRESGLHLDAVMSLAACAAVTERIKFGTAILIPLRHALQTLQYLGSLSLLSGERVLAVGLGLGAFAKEFESIGLDYAKRRQMVKETLEVFRAGMTGEPMTHHGEVYDFEGVTINPALPAGTPVYYGGSASLKAARWAFENDFDGWMGAVPSDVFGEMAALRQEYEQQRGRPLHLMNIPVTTVAETEQRALSRLDIDTVVRSARRSLRRDYQSFDDVRSGMVVGDPEQAAEQIRHFWGRGINPVVLDLRVVGDEFDSVLDLIGKEVIPLCQ